MKDGLKPSIPNHQTTPYSWVYDQTPEAAEARDHGCQMYIVLIRMRRKRLEREERLAESQAKASSTA